MFIEEEFTALKDIIMDVCDEEIYKVCESYANVTVTEALQNLRDRIKFEFDMISSEEFGTPKPQNPAVTALADAFCNEFLDSSGKTLYSVMLFETEINLGMSNNPGKWVNIHTVDFGNDGKRALYFYANKPCTASQLIEATSPEELIEKKKQMCANFQDEKWLEEELYPTL